MRSRFRSRRLRVALAGLVFGLGWGGVSSADAADPRMTVEPGSVAPVQREAADKAVFISTLDAPSTTCSRTNEMSGTCYIEWPYVYAVAGAGQYMISMTTKIGGRVRAHTQGFFQTYMYLPSTMYEPGFAVTCGPPGAGGYSDLGKTYTILITAQDSAGSEATTTTTVSCPFTIHLFSDGFESHDTSAWSATYP